MRISFVRNRKSSLCGKILETYVGKSALDWVVERQYVKTDKDSGIVNDADSWSVETMGNSKYPLELYMRVISVSLVTMKIVRGLPGLEIG